MDWLGQLDFDKFIVFTLVLTRVSGLTMTAPIYGSTNAPMRVRAPVGLGLGCSDYALAMERGLRLSPATCWIIWLSSAAN